MAKPRVRRMADGSTAMVTNDGLVNMVAGLGTSRDKGALATYYFSQLSDHEIVAAYTSSALAARVVDMPAEDACREWREWSADGDDTGLIEAEESRLGLKFKTLEAQRIARLFGGAAIYIGDGSKTPDQPLRAETITAGGLQYLEVLTPRQLSPGPLSDRLGGSGFGRPEYWQLNTMDQTGQRIHPSRLAIFYGTEPLRDYAVTSGWGFSVLQGGLPSIKRVEEVAGNINSLVYEAKVDVFGIPDLMQNLATRGDAYSSEVIRRVTLAATAKGINGMLIRDAAETYEQKSASFGTLDTILDRFMHLCSADFGIPAQLLFSASIGGLGASGDIHTRGYYDRVRVHQTMRMGPAMALLDECMIRSALGVSPPEVHYEWRSLWQPTAKERAEVGKIIVDTFAALDTMDILPAESISAAVVNALVEAGAAPGLEAAIEANEAETGESDGDEVEQEAETLQPTNDAAPKTLYVRRDVLNAAEIIEWAKGQGFKTTLPADDLHVTIAFSRAPVDWMAVGNSWESDIELNAGGPRMMEAFGAAKVLLFASSHLSWRHEEIKGAGATWDHPEYQPHITISYDPDAPDIANVAPYTGKIILGPEIFQEVKEDWANGLVEA